MVTKSPRSSPLSDWPAETELDTKAIAGLQNVSWALPLLRKLEQQGGILQANIPLLFELRFAHELHRRNRLAEYEFPTGVGDSTVDFRIPNVTNWLVELVSIRESDAALGATVDSGLFFGLVLTSTGATDSKETEAGEMLLVQQKIGEKVYRNGPIKFPTPQAGSFHMILVDMRGYLGGIPVVDHHDYRQIADGPHRVPDYAVQFWRNEPIKGLFEVANPLLAAATIRERIHFLGFVHERSYADGEIPAIASYFANAHLFRDIAEARAAFEAFPLKRHQASEATPPL